MIPDPAFAARKLRVATSCVCDGADALREYQQALGCDSNLPQAAQAVSAIGLLEQVQVIVDALREVVSPSEEALAQLPPPPPTADPTPGDGEPCIACGNAILPTEPRIQRPDDGETVYLHERCPR
jgi:hypothetical protein